MANLKEIRNRIVSVDSTMQITSAMKMVSAAKLKRAQDSFSRMRPYSDKLQDILANLSASIDMSENTYASDKEVENVLLIPITSNRGLCGGFNNYIIKETKRLAIEEYAGKNVSVLSIGKKANDAFKRTEYNIKGTYLPSQLEELWNNLTFANVAPAAEKILKAYTDGHLDKVILIYNHSKNVATQIVTVEQFLPIVPTVAEKESNMSMDYIFEPSEAEIVEDLIPKSLKIQIYSVMLDSYAGEHGARMTAMHKATDNATEMNKQLKLDYNKARQAAITNEILEIVSGAEALNG